MLISVDGVLEEVGEIAKQIQLVLADERAGIEAMRFDTRNQ